MKSSARLCLALALLALAGCRKDDKAAPAAEQKSDAPAPSASNLPSEVKAAEAGVADDGEAFRREQIQKYGSCEVEFDGTLKAKFTAPGGKSALGADYFMNDDEMRQFLSFLIRDPTKLDQAMKEDPRVTLFIVNCATDGLSLSFGAGAGTTSKEIPFGPGKYRMGNQKGRVAFLGSLENHKKMFRLKDEGSFEFTRFDASGAQGMFEFEAEGDFTGKVRGKFDYKCAHDTSVCAAARK